VWVADDAPPGAVLQDNSTPTPTAPTTTTPGWPQAPAGTETPVIEDDFGTAATGGVRTSTAITRAGHRASSSTIWVRLKVPGWMHSSAGSRGAWTRPTI
jgi:hypothetical protein